MTHGAAIYNASGAEIMRTPAVRGGVYVGEYTLPVGSSGTLTFANCAAGSLQVLQHQGGMHAWDIGTNGSGRPVINYTAYTPVGNVPARHTRLVVFTLNPIDDAYGMIANNLLGERVFGTTFMKPEFLGKFTLSENGASDGIANTGWLVQNYQSAYSSIGAGRTRVIFYSLLDTGAQDVYYAPTWNFVDPSQINYQCGINIFFRSGASFAVPTAYVFAVDGAAANSDGWGLQVFNSAGQLTFDAGKNHIIIREIGGTYSFPSPAFPDYGYTPNTYALPSLPDNPATFLTNFTMQAWEPTGESSSMERNYVGAFRRSGNTLYSRIFHVSNFFEDAYVSGVNEYGSVNNIVMPFINGNEY